MAVSLGRGETLIPEVHGKGEGFAEGFGEGLGFGGLGAQVAGKIQGIPENNGGTVEPAKEPAERPEVLAKAFAGEGEHGLRGEAELVRNGHADAAGAIVEAEEAGRHSSS